MNATVWVLMLLMFAGMGFSVTYVIRADMGLPMVPEVLQRLRLQYQQALIEHLGRWSRRVLVSTEHARGSLRISIAPLIEHLVTWSRALLSAEHVNASLRIFIARLQPSGSRALMTIGRLSLAQAFEPQSVSRLFAMARTKPREADLMAALRQAVQAGKQACHVTATTPPDRLSPSATPPARRRST